jgi:hypothetical protein
MKFELNEETKELWLYSFYSFRFQHIVYFWGGIREPSRKKGGLFSELTVTSLRKPMRFETKKRKNGGAGGAGVGTLPQHGATGVAAACSGGMRRH